jgi:hypothetical protein
MSFLEFMLWGEVMEYSSKEIRLFESSYQCATCISVICQS